MRVDAEIMKIAIPPFCAGERPVEPNAGNGNSITTTFSGPPKPEQAEVHELMTEFQHLFALSDLELGCTSLEKHNIRVDNPVPFKERYWRIPPQEF